MKSLLLKLSLVGVTLFFYRCVSVENVDTPRVNPIFSKQAKEWGGVFSEALISTAEEIKRKKIKLNDRNAVFAVSENVTWNTLEHKELVTTDQRISLASARKNVIEPMSLAQVLASQDLTDKQREILGQIEEARIESGSYIEFSNRLATIHNGIVENVSKEDQVLLYSVTSTLYYGLEAINKLVERSILPGSPEQGNMTLAHLKIKIPSAIAESESGSGSWWSSWGKCAAGIIGGVGSGALAGASFGGAGCTVVLPLVGTVACGAVGGVVGGISGGLLGAVGGC
ncbi:MAG: hypothetical protein MI784_13535 [Cytophagales bacterium]|nr:hypothetical protein [Cytophagales bacterium]